jgi:hypothetical protein
LAAILLTVYFSCAIAVDTLSDTIEDDSLLESNNHEEQYEINSESGIEIGALIVIGADFRVFYRKLDSPWLFGFRYLNTEDDFVNEEYAGFPGDESDRELRTTTGIFLNYLFDHLDDNSFYLSGALYDTTEEIRCNGESASDSATSVYFGGGYRRFWGEHFGFKLGMLVSPFVNLETTTPTCSSKSHNDIDLDVSLVIKF